MKSEEHSRKKHLRSFGRIKSRALKPNQQRLMDDILPQIEIQSYTDLPDGFDNLIVEIGFGGGEHLIHQAVNNPKNLYIGCEPYINGSVKALAQIEELELKNIRIYTEDCRDLLETFPESSIDKVFILYPDPWPKLRHNKRRLINEGFLNFLAAKIKDGAITRFITDWDDYAKWTLIRFLDNDNFRWTASSKTDWQVLPKDHIETKYQKKALKEGRKPLSMEFERINHE